MSYNVIVGLGNAGTQIVKLASKSKKLDNVKLFAVDSVITNVTMDDVNSFKYIPIISDEKSGSGRSRERGMAMYEFQEENGKFDEMYKTIEGAKQPIIVVSSSAGGTGSGSLVPFCKHLVSRGIKVIPIIIIPSLEDPVAYHLNTTDLMIDLDGIVKVIDNVEYNVKTYSTFRNINGVSNYEDINREIVESIELILGKHYEYKDKDSVDDSDLDVTLSIPGRFISFIETTNSLEELKKNIIKRIFNGYQPAWTSLTSMTIKTFGLKSMFASKEFDEAFSELNGLIANEYDEYKNIVDDNNNGKYTATVIIAGLPQAELKQIKTDFTVDKGLADGMKKSERPSFISKRKATVTTQQTSDDKHESIKKFGWK